MAARNTQQTDADDWRQIVTSLYPDALTRTYCVPPVQFNRVPYVRDVVPGTGLSVHVLQPRPSARFLHTALSTKPEGWTVPQHMWAEEPGPHLPPVGMQESDLRDDFAQNHVMLNLQELGDSRHETMFILSQLQFGSYLNEPVYAAAAKQLPRPKDLPRDRQGDFDFLLIHRQHSILVGELKSVGKNSNAANETDDDAIAQKVKKAVKQLDKSERVVRHLVSDMGPGMTVKKTLFLPYVSSAQLERVLDNDEQLEQAVCQSLGAANAAEAVQLCCCSDQLSQPASYWHVTPAVLSQLSTWWQHRMACTVDARLTDQLYLDIVARFVGPATTVSVPCYNGVRVEVRTTGQAVAELGRRLALLVLTLQQLDLMNRDPPLVHITGAPGTGKTVVLVLQGVRWLRQGHDVHVISTRYATRAVSTSIKQQLEMSLSAGPTPSLTPGSVSYHLYDIWNREGDVDQAVTDLVACVKNGHLHVLIDEVSFDSRTKLGPRHTRLVTRLAQQVPHLYLWCAGIHNTEIPPALQTQVFTVPLRSAPAVLREIQPVIHRYPVHDYSDSGVPAPGDGLSVIRLSHHGNAHTGRWPVDCAQCGQDIAAELSRLGVGKLCSW
ncbi:hypothetical protein V1264_002549 [Littorina saxatilis]|uniref:Uncharacterized protein n=1 Tax=Littorina saxatilis TaxID=31220 RepID=A0AAN9B3F7_9CAEN